MNKIINLMNNKMIFSFSLLFFENVLHYGNGLIQQSGAANDKEIRHHGYGSGHPFPAAGFRSERR